MRRDFGAELLANILTIVRWPKSSLNLRVLNPSPQGSTRGLGLRPPAPGPLWRGDRRRRRNCTGSESEADSRAFQVVVTIGAESWTPISQGILCKRVK